MKKASRQTIECREAKIAKVTVFTDRAEIKRCLGIKLEPGFNEIDIVPIPGEVFDDSIRVSGNGEALIHEVQFAVKEATKEEKDCPQAKELREKLETTERELKRVINERRIVEKQKDSLNQLLDKMGNVGETRSLEISAVTLQAIAQMITFHRDEVTRLNDLDIELERKEKDLREKSTITTADLQPYDLIRQIRSVKVVLEAECDLRIDLCLCYQVKNAYWHPSYDIRVELDGEAKMSMTYFGQVSQLSGEEWSDCELILSTACPSRGGNVPELGTLDVFFDYPRYPQKKNAFSLSSTTRKISRRALHSGDFEECRAGNFQSICESTSLKDAMAEIKNLTLFSEFSIARPAEIFPDGAEHKVTIGMTSLEPLIHYECVPSKSSDVYLMASTVNESTLSFLPGQTAIFMDGNFVTKSSIKFVSPGEHFVVGLGIDSAIRVDTKPPLNKASGKDDKWFTTKRTQTVRDQKISIKNTRKERILLKLKEHVPRSTDDKITVKLLSPDMQKVLVRDVEENETTQPGIILNKTTNNLEWTMEILGQEKMDLSIRTLIEFPTRAPLGFAERF